MTTATTESTTTADTDELQAAAEVLTGNTTRWRPASDWAVATHLAPLFDRLPESFAPAFIATCKFLVKGPKADPILAYGEGKGNWGAWIKTVGQSTEKLEGIIDRRQFVTFGMWLNVDSREAFDAILECFGVEADDVFLAYGDPVEGAVYEVSLMEILRLLASDLVAEVTEPELATKAA